ncbi:MAG: hypothetical protein Q7S22_08695 [Candidatus Micrarchaeota archaeon]|nr:hypothetical protein [Candidatus Micrarchaeota archaeon]
MTTMLMKRRVLDVVVRGVTYPEARKRVKEFGLQLPSNSFFHKFHTGEEKTLRLNLDYGYGAFAREVLVFPERDGVFTRGKDMIDPFSHLVFPASYLARVNEVREIFGVKKVGLFVDPEDVTTEQDRFIVHPANVVILSPFIQVNHGKHIVSSHVTGTLHPETKVPLAAKPEKLVALSSSDIGYLERVEGLGVRPIVRNIFDHAYADIVYTTVLHANALALLTLLAVDPDSVSLKRLLDSGAFSIS